METQYKKLIVFIPAINCCFIHLMIYSISWVIAVGEKTRIYSLSIACYNLCMGDSETVITDTYELWSKRHFCQFQNDLIAWYITIINYKQITKVFFFVYDTKFDLSDIILSNNLNHVYRNWKYQEGKKRSYSIIVECHIATKYWKSTTVQDI